MGARFLVFGLAIVGIVACAFVSLRTGEAGLLEVFFWLGLLLVTCAIALWPFAGSDQRAELKLEHPSWADRVEFREPRAVPRSGVSERGDSVDSGTWRVG